jgi:hypothetical protein
MRKKEDRESGLYSICRYFGATGYDKDGGPVQVYKPYYTNVVVKCKYSSPRPGGGTTDNG